MQQAIQLFAYHTGIKLISARQDIDIHALKTNIEMLAKLQINATAEGIEITGTEEVLINGGGSYTRWSASGVERGTSGRHTLHAASHSMDGPQGLPVAMPALQVLAPERQLRTIYHDQDPVRGAPFTIEYTDGGRYSGQLDAQGQADLSAAPTGSGRIRPQDDTRAYAIKASERNTEHRGAWGEADFEASLQQASRAEQP